MKRFLTIMLVLLFATTAYSVDPQDITFYTMQPTDTLVKTMRTAVSELNTDIANAGSNLGAADVWYVDATNGSATNTGKTAAKAMSTLNGAINLAGVGDYIYILESSSEAMGAAADEVDVDVDGLTIIGLGSGSDMATFDYTGDVTGAFAVGADNVTLVNLRFHANVPDVNDAIDVEAGSTDLKILGCLFDTETEGTDEFHQAINFSGAASDRFVIDGCEFHMGAGAAGCAIEFLDSDYAQITNNKFSGDYAIADVNNVTTASNFITIAGNEIVNGTIGGAAGLNAQPCIELVATTSGVIAGNTLVCNVATPDAAIVGLDMYVTGNVYSETEGGVSAAPMWLTTDTVMNPIGLDDANNEFVSSTVAANADGSILERLEQIDVDTSAITAASAGPRYISCATADFTASADDLFLVAGGPIEIISFFGLCTTLAGGNPGDLKIHCDATTGDQDRDFSTTVTVDTLAAGDSVRFTNAIDEGVLDFTANVGAGQQLSWFCPIGTIETSLTSTGTGACTWYMVYRPLDSASAVTAAP